MINLSSEATAALSSSTVNMVQLIKMDFPTTTLALNTSNFNITYDGIEYLGAYGLGSINEVEDSPGEIKGLQFTLNAGAADTISLALDEAGIWQGTPITIRTAILNNDFQVVSAVVSWKGSGDTLSIQEDGNIAAVQVTAESEAVDFMRGHKLTFNHSDQQMLYPEDLGFEYLDSQVNSQVVWPAKEWFKK